ncbi:MAG: hypothetical protein QW534_09585, partial [Candidatus Methanomethylicia archaeon]
VKHIIEFSNEENTLLAIGTLTNGSEAIIYYELEKPIEWLKTEAAILKYLNDKIVVYGKSINGRLINLTLSNSCPPDECTFPDIGCGPGETCQEVCCEYDYNCLVRCVLGGVCPSCVAACLRGDILYCIAFAIVFCPICLLSCCTDSYWTCVYYGGP